LANRRDFLIGATSAGVGFGLGAFSHNFPLPSPHVGPDWRPGAEQLVPSSCLLCPAHCGIRARLVDDVITGIVGNPLHPVSQGGLCPKGLAGIQLVYHPGRLKGPMRRVGPAGSDRFEPISWDVALQEVAGALRAARSEDAAGSVEWLVGHAPGLMGELIAAFCRACGTRRVFSDDYRDGSADVIRMCQGIGSAPAYDLAGSDLVLSFGAALSEAWWALPQAARAREAEAGRAPRWVQVDVRLSRTAVAADQWIPVRPGSYGTLALGLVYLIAKEGLYDADTVSGRVAGWEDWTDETGTRQLGLRTLVFRHGRPDDVSARTGVPVTRLVELAKAFGTARSPVAIWDHAVSWRKGGLADALAIHALNTLAGRLNRPGGLLVQPPLRLPGPLGSEAAGGVQDLSQAPLAATSWISGAGTRPAAKMLFLYQSNPLASLGRGEEVRQLLSQIPLVVSFSPFLDETARYANLLLPDHTYLERWQDAPAPAAVAFPVWGVVQPVVKPLHDTRASGDLILELARRLDGEPASWSRWSSIEELVHARGAALAAAERGSAFVDGLRRNELRELEGRGWWLPHGETTEEYWQTILKTGGWFDPIYDYHDRSGISQHPDGRVWLFPAEARRRLRDTKAGLVEGFLPIEAAAPAREEPPPDDSLRLVPFRVLTLASGGVPLMPWLLEHLGVLSGSAWETWAEVSPETARKLGLSTGQRVRIESPHGGFEATLRVFAGAQPGVVNVPYGLHTRVAGWGEPRGASPLAAVGDQADPATQLPDWYSTRVRLTRV